MPSPDLPPQLPRAASAPVRSGTATFLSLILLLFLANAVFAFLDASLLLFFQREDLSIVNGLLTLLMLLTGFLGCCVTALHAGIPKRFFLPVCLFLPVANIAVLPLWVFFHAQGHWITWGIALGQLLLGLIILRRVQKEAGDRWPLFPASQITGRKFSWGNLAAVILAGILVLLPALLLYTAFSAKLAVHHFTDGFVTLRPSGISMEVRKYIRDDGRKITLVPMSHVGGAEFYRDLAASFPADSVILMEGVTDKEHVMAGHLDYSRMASAVGGVQQVTAFKPPGEIVAADVDISSFSSTTRDLLKSAMLFHAKGLTPETLPILMKPTPPDAARRLMDDILTKRNNHLLDVIQDRLSTSGDLIVPWGAAHMPGIARAIQKAGFHMVGTQEFVVIRFGS